MAKKGRAKRGSSRDKVRQRAKDGPRRGGAFPLSLPKDMDFWNPKASKKPTTFDIIEFPVGEGGIHAEAVDEGEYYPRHKYSVHRNIGTQEITVICPARTFDKKCPICEDLILLRKDKDKNEELIEAIKDKLREVFIVLVDDELKVLDMSFYTFGETLDEESGAQDDDAPFYGDSSEDGVSIEARWKESTFGKTKYIEISKVNFVEREEAIDEDILEEVDELNPADWFNVLPYDKLSDIYYGADDDEEELDDDEDDDNEEETPRKSRKKKSRDKDEDDDEKNEDEDDEEEDDDEPSKSKRRRRGKKVDEDAENNDDEEDDEDEEEKPPSKSKKSKKSKSEKKKKKKKSKDPECPEGGDFGEDWGELDDCETCALWDECSEAADEDD